MKIAYSALFNCMTVSEYFLDAIVKTYQELRSPNGDSLHDSFDKAGESNFEESKPQFEEIKEDDEELVESPLRRAMTEERDCDQNY